MNGLDNIRAITENLKKALSATGITLMEGRGDAKNVPASRIPCAAVAYNGEAFEYTIGSRPAYAEAEFAVRVFLKAGNDEELTGDLQSWAHGIRDALTVEALNANSLAGTRPVSRVMFERVEVETGAAVPALKCAIRVRYRESV